MQQQAARTLTSLILVLGGLAVTAGARSMETVSMKQGVRYFKSLKFLSLLFSLLTLSAGIAFGQAISGNLVGTVSDPTGAMVPNAKATRPTVGTTPTAAR